MTLAPCAQLLSAWTICVIGVKDILLGKVMMVSSSLGNQVGQGGHNLRLDVGIGNWLAWHLGSSLSG